MADVFVLRGWRQGRRRGRSQQGPRGSQGCLVVLIMYTPLVQMPFVDYVEYVLVSRLSLHRCLNECNLRMLSRWLTTWLVA